MGSRAWLLWRRIWVAATLGALLLLAVGHVSAFAQEPTRVYGLPGKLSVADNQPFSYYFVARNGENIGVVGETALIEQQMDELARQAPAVDVKIWGTRQSATDSMPAIIIISEILTEGVTPVIPASATPSAASALATVRVNGVNLYSGPGQNYPVVDRLKLEQQCQIIGRVPSADWLQVDCVDAPPGWVATQLLNVSAVTLNLPIVVAPTLPTPTAAATATPNILNWRAAYFNNTTLSGAPVLVVDVASIDMNWGGSAPAPGVNAENFSARFERTIDFAPATYRFRARVDDGIRVWVDNQLIIDQWTISAGDREYVVDLPLSGRHALRVEYYEATGLAFVSFSYAVAPVVPPTATPSTIQAPDFGGSIWSAEYFGNRDLSGNPVMVRREGANSAAPLDHLWDTGTPGYGVPSSNWSARWQGRFSFVNGNYVFAARVDDGVRIFIDNIQLLENWRDGYWEGFNNFFDLGQGFHTIRVEYYNRTGEARLRIWWYQDDGPQLAP